MSAPTLTNSEESLIHSIAKRATKLRIYEGPFALLDAVMDLEAVHTRVQPLRLLDLLHADDGNFGHDLAGIKQHLDRSKHELGECFLPRYAAASKSWLRPS